MELFETYIRDTAPVLFFEMDVQGNILSMNAHAREMIEVPENPVKFTDLILDFRHCFDLEGILNSRDKTQMLTVKTRGETLNSFVFSFSRQGEHIAVLGHREVEEFDLLWKEVLAMNRELSQNHRAMHRKIATLQQALDNARLVEGILPICMFCHKIRNPDHRDWERLETFFGEAAGMSFSHGICPECLDHHYPDSSREESD